MNNADIQKYFNISPSILTLIPTHKCTASCNNCCFSCSPNISYIMDMKTMKKIITDAMQSFPHLKVLVITGGECFLLRDDLTEIIKYAVKKYKLIVRVVTNAYWATSFEQAEERLRPLVDAGLTEINFSTGDEHQQFVKFQNIVNAVLASVELNLSTILISVETPPNGKFTSIQLQQNSSIKSLIENERIGYIDAAWMYFKNLDTTNNNTSCPQPIFQRQRKPCESIFRGININPHSQLLACCGLTVEYNPFLKLGDINQHLIKDLYFSQFNDMFKIWLLVDGPKFIYDKIMQYRGLKPKLLPHDCAYCIETVQNKDNLGILKQILPNEIPSILYRHKILNQGIKIDTKKFCQEI